MHQKKLEEKQQKLDEAKKEKKRQEDYMYATMHPELNLQKSDDDQTYIKMKPKGILARAAEKMKNEELKKEDELTQEATEAIMSPEYQSQLKKQFQLMTKSKKQKQL